MRQRIVVIFIWGLVAAGFCSEGFAQDERETATAVEGGQVSAVTGGESYPIPGSHVLWRQEEEVRRFLAENPWALEQQTVRKTSAWTFTVGSQYVWYADDLSEEVSVRYTVPSTCRAVGTRCYVFVEDAVWGSTVTQAAVDSVRTAFDSRIPSDPGKGMYQTVVESFGNPPDIDLDPRIVILILDIRDGYTGSGAYLAGYFYSFNQVPRTVPGYATSNEAEIYFVDANPTNLTTPSGLRSALSTMAHEFQHMIHYNYDRGELTFFNEMCSVTAEVVCGYPIYSQSLFVNEVNHYLLDWRSNISVAVRDYSRAARFGVYLLDQFGRGLFPFLVSSTLVGIPGINQALTAVNAGRSFNQVLIDWCVANILDDRSVSANYGYLYPGLPKAVGTLYAHPNVAVTGASVERLAATYLSFVGGSDLRITFALSNASLLVKAVEVGPGGKRVLDVPGGVEFHEPEFGSTYTEIHFVVINVSQVSAYAFDYTASGTGTQAVELKWDFSEPVGYLPQTAGDTVCVTFPGSPGARLDSIRVALRRAGTMVGGVWRYTGVLRPTPLGARLAVPVLASTGTTPPFPYPVPWPNWGTVDLRGYGIDASAPFAVAFVNQGDPSVEPRVMVTPYPSSGAFNNFSWLNQPSSGTPDWYYLSKSADTVWLYMIRAYVSFGTTDAGEPHELLPSSVVLSQNYPNPFNPSTTIRFSVPERAHVTLRIHTVLGEQVATLVDGVLGAGVQEVKWSPQDLPSGMYLYRLQASGRTETKRLVLLR